ncbi:MAG: stage V sporulation protein AC [Clostridia bacterium]|nr:stage V sporulation protein AC [Clostridia bacterium]MBQ4625026.1 stage V sporulation protein AC [Clostridia bacterium]
MRFTKNKEEYAAYYKSLSPKSPLLRDLTGAFLIGGTICLLGQLLTEGYTALGANKELSGTLTSVTLIALGILLSALGLYAKLAKFAGAGTLVPITGFANSMASAAIEFKSEGFILGVGARMFQIAGPVIVYGVSASVVYGVIYWITTLF